MEFDYDFVIVGSGFGGAVTACRLAEAGKRVLVLERGRWWKPPAEPGINPLLLEQFPEDATPYPRAPGDPWLWVSEGPDVVADGWIQFHVWPRMTVATAAGVGGGSLVYANVSEVPPENTFAEGWPQGTDRETLLPYYKRAGKMLNVQQLPDNQLTARFKLVRDAAQAVGDGDRFRKANLAITFSDKYPTHPEAPFSNANAEVWKNEFGRYQGTCVHSGNCDLGCQVLAKNTLDLNYLARAQSCGAEIRAHSQVSHVAPREGGGYTVFYTHVHPAGVVGAVEEGLEERVEERVEEGLEQGAEDLAQGLEKTVAGGAQGLEKGIGGLAAELEKEAGALGLKGLEKGIEGAARGLETGIEGAAQGLEKKIGGVEEEAVVEIGGLGQKQVTARYVILAAGSLGSTEILLRSREQYGTLPHVSKALGSRWSSNGDYLTPAIYPADAPPVSPTHGPTITCFIDYLDTEGGPQYVIEDGGIPPVARDWLVQTLTTLEKDWKGMPAVLRQALESLVQRITNDDEAARLMPWFANGRDAGNGQLLLRQTLGLGWELVLKWDVTDSVPAFNAEIGRQIQLAVTTGGLSAVLPTWGTLWSEPHTLITPHPLGGCPMADTADEGVVDVYGRVFGYEGLYVADGSIIPRPIGINPSRTIAALAERIAERILNPE